MDLEILQLDMEEQCLGQAGLVHREVRGPTLEELKQQNSYFCVKFFNIREMASYEAKPLLCKIFISIFDPFCTKNMLAAFKSRCIIFK